MSLIRKMIGPLTLLAVVLLGGCGSDDPSPVAVPQVSAAMTALQVTPAVVSKSAGLLQRYVAIATYDDGHTADVSSTATWTSSAASVAAIDATGVAATRALGTASVSASVGGIVSNVATLGVTAARLRTIQVTPPIASFAAGMTQQYTATGTYTDGSVTDISASVAWSSSDTTRATIDAGGMVHGRAVGGAAITAALDGVTSNAASIDVSDASLVAISVTSATASRPVGIAVQYNAIAVFSDGTSRDVTGSARWATSDPTEATIDAAGLAHPSAPGSVAVTASQGGVTSGAALLTITPAALVSIQTMPATASLPVGLTQQYTAIGTFTDGSTQDVSSAAAWNSSRTERATVSPTGLATSVAVGDSAITATLGGIVSNVARLQVAGAVLTSITITPAASTVAVKAPQAYQATGRYTDGSTQSLASSVAWQSNDATKVFVSGGYAQVIAAGNYTITASVGAVTSNTTTLTVVAPGGVATGSLAAPRAITNAVLLPDGSAFVAGGFGLYFGNDATAETYDPTSGTWSLTAGTMAVGHQAAVSVLLISGKVLVAGGSDKLTGKPTPVAELYDPTTRTFSTTGPMQVARAGATFTLLPDGRVLAAGGADGQRNDFASAELYDPATGAWTRTASMSTPRFGHGATMLADGRVLVAGGSPAEGTVTASVEIYDPATATWTPVAPMGVARQDARMLTLADGRVFVAGGTGAEPTGFDSGELFDPATGRWTATGTMSTRRYGFGMVLLPSGKVLLTGGVVDNQYTLDTMEVFDPLTARFAAPTFMVGAHAFHAAVVLRSGRVLVVSGHGYSAPVWTPDCELD